MASRGGGSAARTRPRRLLASRAGGGRTCTRRRPHTHPAAALRPHWQRRSAESRPRRGGRKPREGGSEEAEGGRGMEGIRRREERDKGGGRKRIRYRERRGREMRGEEPETWKISGGRRR